MCLSGQHAHDVRLLHDQEFLAVELDLGARPFAEQHAVADLEIDRDQLAGFVPAARSDRRDFALRGLLLAVSGMMMPPFDFASASMRLTTTRSCSGRNWDLAMAVPLAGWFQIDRDRTPVLNSATYQHRIRWQSRSLSANCALGNMA